MKFDYQCNFNLQDCIKTLGLDTKGRVQQVVTNAVLELSEPYVPFENGALLASGRIEDDTTVVWGEGVDAVQYARDMWNGIVYEDPAQCSTGFQTENGWRSRKDVQKVPTERELQYHNGSLRGKRWVDRMLQNGGREKIEQMARKAAGE